MSAQQHDPDLTVYRKHYQPPPFQVVHADLEFELDLDRTFAQSRAVYRQNPEVSPTDTLRLDARELRLEWIRIDGEAVSEADYEIDDRGLTITGVPAEFVLEIRNSFVPRGNTTLMGLCLSRDGGLFTQCEPEAFRKLTYFQDRPDILCTWTTRLTAEKERYPVLLSNGHPQESGDLEDGRHFAVWHNPFPTPCYIFAIMAGPLISAHDTYTFKSGKTIQLGVYATAENLDKVRHSLEILKKSIEWDENLYGRECDVETYNCGVLNGCTGGMENKGLNLFDLNWFTTSPRLVFDPDYEYRMKTIGHEYFHNWSGNIVTVKNWFQVALKEGLTRFRDQRFVGDMSSQDAVRIKMVRHIRANQWTEDAGPLVHPVICDDYVDPRNTFTNTTYDKGQEIIYMIMTLLGEATFLEGVRRYFDDNTYTAVTIDEFLSAMEAVSGESMSQMAEWFYQAGTPTVEVGSHYDADARTFTVNLKQSTDPTPGQPVKKPMRIPVAAALLNPRGQEIEIQLRGEAESRGTQTVLDFTREQQSFVFEEVADRPVPSLFRHFSAPVPVRQNLSDEDLAHLLRYDRDGVTRWDVSEAYASRVILRRVEDARAGRDSDDDAKFLQAYASSLDDEEIDPRLICDLMTLPDEKTLGQAFDVVPIEQIHTAREEVRLAIARHSRQRFLELYRANEHTGAMDVSAGAIGTRRLKALCLDYLVALGDGDMDELAVAQVADSPNVSDQIYAIISLANSDSSRRAEALDIFRDRWRDEQIVFDKWFYAQAIAARTDTAARLRPHLFSDEFPPQMLSRVFSTTEALFCLNRCALNASDGSGYDLMADLLPAMDRHSPLVATFMLGRSDAANWRRFDPARQAMIHDCLRCIRNADGVSDGLVELADKTLEGA